MGRQLFGGLVIVRRELAEAFQQLRSALAERLTPAHLQRHGKLAYQLALDAALESQQVSSLFDKAMPTVEATYAYGPAGSSILASDIAEVRKRLVRRYLNAVAREVCAQWMSLAGAKAEDIGIRERLKSEQNKKAAAVQR